MEGTDAKVIGSRILECRKKLKYSREKLAEAADVSNSFLAEVEHGTKNFSVPVLARLCKALGVSADISCSAGKMRRTHPASSRCSPASTLNTCHVWRNFWPLISRP